MDHARIFALCIVMDPDGIEWTHFQGLMQHTRTPREMPAPLWERLQPIVEALRNAGVKRFSFPNVRGELPPKAPENALATLALAAWWLEWDHRKTLTHGSDWRCPSCEGVVKAMRGHCDRPGCDSWNHLHAATGAPDLHLVVGAKSA